MMPRAVPMGYSRQPYDRYRGRGRAYRRGVLDSLQKTLEGMPAFLRDMPLVELSTRHSEDFRTGRTLFARGALLAADLDERIRLQSGGRVRARDAFRHFVAWRERHRRGFRIEELPGIFRDATGVDTRGRVGWLASMSGTRQAASGRDIGWNHRQL
jgi:hypothetical protein